MSPSRSACLTLLALLAAWSHAQEAVSRITVLGSDSGENRYTERSDGTFVSSTKLEVGPQRIESKAEGKWSGAALEWFAMDATQSGSLTQATWRDGKLTVVQGGKTVLEDRPAKFGTLGVFSALHPQLSRRFVLSLAADPGTKEAKALLLDNVAEVPVQVKSVGAKTVSVQGGNVAAKVVSLSLAGLDFDVVAGEEAVLGLRVPAQSLSFVLEGASGVFDDPMAKYPELSQPRYGVKRIEGARSRMRDGTVLVGDVVLPDKPGKWPTVLVRTPYAKELSMLQGEFYARRGYAYMAQDVRGRGMSEGEFDPLVTERADGYDTLEWIVGQEWSDGRVGMIGASYLGYVQWAAATTGHRALRCIVPQVSPPDPVRNFPWDHGNFMLAASLWWTRITGARSSGVETALQDLTGMKALETLPLTKVDDKFHGKSIPFFDRWLERDSLAKWAGAHTLADAAKVKIPVLHVSGIWDGDGIGTKLHWEALRAARHRRQWLVFGPWNHFFNTSRRMGATDYGDEAILELDSLYLRFFDTWLKGREGMMDSVPRVKFFLTGANRWLTAGDWPLPGSKPRVWYLGGGKAEGLDGGGSLLERHRPASPATYVYDPAKLKVEDDTLQIDANASVEVPKGTIGKGTLVFRTQPFAKPTRVSGPFDTDLYVSTSVRDAAFHVAVAEQRPDGSVHLVGLPGRARIGWKETGVWGPVKPGEVVRLAVRPWEFAHEFPKGSRLVVVVSSDGFPGFARISGTGEPDATATRLLRATQTVYRSARYPSRVTARILP